MNIAEKQIAERVIPLDMSGNESMSKKSAKVDSLSFRLHTSLSTEARRVHSFIAQKYYSAHKASLTDFLPQLLEMHNGNITYGCVGIKPGDFGKFYLEQYIDKPIECAVAEHKRQPICRSSIAEIGNFAVTKSGLSPILIAMVAKTLHLAGFKWMVFTATAEVEKLIHGLGCKTFILADARPEKLEHDAESWGDYYKSKPTVLICDLSESIENAKNRQHLSTLFQKLSKSIHQISQSIKFNTSLM